MDKIIRKAFYPSVFCGTYPTQEKQGTPGAGCQLITQYGQFWDTNQLQSHVSVLREDTRVANGIPKAHGQHASSINKGPRQKSNPQPQKWEANVLKVKPQWQLRFFFLMFYADMSIVNGQYPADRKATDNYSVLFGHSSLLLNSNVMTQNDSIYLRLIFHIIIVSYCFYSLFF